jgi:hypothetical protein
MPGIDQLLGYFLAYSLPLLENAPTNSYSYFLENVEYDRLAQMQLRHARHHCYYRVALIKSLRGPPSEFLPPASAHRHIAPR